jgi:hypothetical protein
MSYKIGVLLCSYSLPEYIHDCLRPWIEARQAKLGGHEFIISAISVPFKEYKDKAEEDTESPKILQEYKEKGLIDYLFTEPKWEEEKVVRNTALNPLLEIENCDFCWLVDCDEFYQLVEIERIMKFVERNPLTCWFRGNLKNYVFSNKEFLALPFNPARIYRTKYQNYKLYGFRYDNEMIYHGTITRDIKDHEQMPSLTIPKTVAFTRHYTWFSDANSKKKCEYQKGRFSLELCSFLWNHNEDKLEFNPLYFSKFGKPIPEVCRED